MTWDVTGPDAGSVAGVAFTAVENLTGASDNHDTFALGTSGSLSGVVDGGTGGFDSLVFDGGGRSDPLDGERSPFRLGRHRRPPGDLLGLEPITVTGTPTDVIYDLTSAADFDTVLAPDGSGGLQITGSTFEGTTFFNVPTGSLTINGLGGYDAITVSGSFPVLGAMSLTINAEHIDVATGTVFVTDGTVSLAARALNPSASPPTALVATVLVNGSITATGGIVISAETERIVSLTGQTLNSDVQFTFDSEATAEVSGVGVVLTADKLYISASTRLGFTWEGDAPPATVYDKLNLPNDSSVNVGVTNVTHAGIGGGARAAVGSAAISASDPASLAIEASDDTSIDVHITDSSTPTSAAALATNIGDFLTFDRLVASTTVSRDTRAYAEDAPATGKTLDVDGDARIHAENTGALNLEIVSDFVGTASNTVTKDDAVAALDLATVDAGGVELIAHTGTTYGATAKDVTNDVTGVTTAIVAGTTLGAGADGVSLDARDDSSLTALSHNMVQVPGTPFVTITSARARNDVTATTEARSTGSSVTVDGGDLDVARDRQRDGDRDDAVGLDPREVRLLPQQHRPVEVGEGRRRHARHQRDPRRRRRAHLRQHGRRRTT